VAYLVPAGSLSGEGRKKTRRLQELVLVRKVRLPPLLEVRDTIIFPREAIMIRAPGTTHAVTTVQRSLKHVRLLLNAEIRNPQILKKVPQKVVVVVAHQRGPASARSTCGRRRKSILPPSTTVLPAMIIKTGARRRLAPGLANQMAVLHIIIINKMVAPQKLIPI